MREDRRSSKRRPPARPASSAEALAVRAGAPAHTGSSTEALNSRAAALEGKSLAAFVAALHREDLAAVRAVGDVADQVAALAEAAALALRLGGRLIYVGAGTSGRLGVLDAAECPPTFGTSPGQVLAVIAGGRRALVRSVEGAEDDTEEGARAMRRVKLSAADLVCGITASGRTPFVLGALKAARQAGATTALLSCNPANARRVKVDLHVTPDTGPELVAGSTRLKAGTATRLVLNAVSTAAMAKLGRVRQGRMVSMRATNSKLKERAMRIMQELTGATLPQAQRALANAGGHLGRALALLAMLLFVQACTCQHPTTCTPTTCGLEGATCGALSDACGGMLDCGSCTAPQSCGGAGSKNRCGCQPTRSCRSAVDCGPVSDGCGATVDCGTCFAPETCGADHLCACMPATCATLAQCGVLSDGCGQPLSCGCSAPLVCGTAGANHCGQAPRCTPDGFCWENPLPRVTVGIDLVGFGPDDVVVADFSGAVLRWHGSSWAELAGLPAGTVPAAVWGVSADDLWVSTATDGHLLHWTGTSWQAPVTLGGANLQTLSGTSSTDVYVGGNLGTLAHFDGTTWSPVTLPSTVQPQVVSQAFARTATDVWAVAFGTLAGTDQSFALHFDGAGWSGVPLTGAPAGFTAVGVYAASAAEVFVAGSVGSGGSTRGAVLRRAGASWAELTLPAATGPLSAISGTSSTDLWVSTTSGAALHFTAATWDSFDVGVPFLPFHRVRAFGTKVWGLGQQTISRFDGSHFQSLLSGSHEDLQAVWVGAPGDGWAAGRNGHFSRFDGVVWAERDSLGARRWFDLAGAPGDLWAVGECGLVRHFGAVWDLSNSNTFSDLHSVSATGPSDAWAVGADRTIIRWNGTTWSALSPAPPVAATRTLLGVFAVSPTEAWVVGEAGTVLRFNAGAWESPTLPAAVATDTFAGVWGAAPDDVWVVGDHGTTLHWDGGSLAEVDNPLSGSINELVDVAGRSSSEVYAVGRQTLKWNGATWVPLDVGGHFISGVAASADGGVVVVGSEGATLRHR